MLRTGTLLTILLLLIFAKEGITQTYYKTGGNVNNTIPFNQTVYKIQFLYEPADFNTLPPGGNITKIYFRGAVASTMGTYANFKVSFTQTTDPNFGTTNFYTGLTTALTAATQTLTTNATAGGWFEIPLTTPFPYNNTQSLIVELQWTGKTGGFDSYTTTATPANKRLYATTIAATTGTRSPLYNDFAMDIGASGPCTPPAQPTAANVTICGPATATLNASTTTTGATLNWYNSATSTTSLGNGTTFTTPVLTANTTYHVQASTGSGGSGGTTGRPAPTVATTWNLEAGVRFDAIAPFLLQSADVYPAGSGPLTVQVRNSASAVLFTTTVTVNSGSTTSPFTIPLGFNIPAGTGYYLTTTNLAGGLTGLVREASGAVFPYTIPGVVSVTSGYLTTNHTSSTYYYFYNITIGGGACNSTRQAVTVTVNPKPDTAVSITGNTILCPGNLVTLNAATGTGLTYQWLLNNNIITGATNSSYTTSAAGSYRVKVANANCTDTSNARVVTVSPPLNARVTPIGATTFCSGDSVILTGPSSPAGLTYQWQLNNGNIAGATDSTIIARVAGNYRLILSNGPCRDTSSNLAVVVNARPAIVVSPANAVVCSAAGISLTASGAATYSWSPAAGLSATTGATVLATPAATTIYIITGTGANGCTGTASKTVNVGTLPAPVITASATSICGGNNVTFTGPAPATGLTYQWLLNGTAIPGATNSTYVATVAGGYRLALSNGMCRDTSAATNLTVNPLPTATATASGPTSFCTGGSVVLNANTGTGLSYRWLRNNVAFLPAATGQSYTATTTGNYSVVVTNTTTGCTDTSRPAVPVTLFTTPGTALNALGSLTFCQGNSVSLNASFVAGATYVWHRNNGVIPGATTPNYTASIAGTYHVVITNGPCVSTTVSRTVVVNPLPDAITIATGPTSFCVGGAVVLNANTGAGLIYQWQVNTIDIPGATSSSYTATTSGTYRVIVSNGNCDNTSGDIAVTVSTIPSAAVTAAGSPVFCQGNSVILQTNAGAGYSYQWLLNTVAIPGANAATHTATATGDYTVVVTNGACVTTSVPYTVSVTPAPTAIVTAAGPTSFCQGSQVKLDASRGTGYTYQWTRNTVAIPGATLSSYIALISGDYGVDIFDGSCPASSVPVSVTSNNFPVAVITVSNGVDMTTGNFAGYQWFRNGVAIPGATAQNYTATRDGYYSVVVTDLAGCSATSPVQLITALDVTQPGGAIAVKLYPNPVEDLLYIASSQAVNICVNALDGKQLLKADNAKSIDLRILPQGIYLVRIADAKTGALIKVERVNKK